MLKVYYDLREINFQKLMELYSQTNAENAAELYANEESSVGILKAEQDFYQYLREVFFLSSGAFYAIWEEENVYISALRIEGYWDGLLLEALETHPAYRRKGYAKMLVSAVLEYLKVKERKTVYSHINKRNTASIKTHSACGFRRISEQATYIDGSVTGRSCTMAYAFDLPMNEKCY